MAVLDALLFTFHNADTGRCFPSWEKIAAAASVSRASVGRALIALEAARVLTWQHRIYRSRLATGPLRSSNAYRFLEPLFVFTESQSATGTKPREVRKSATDEKPVFASPWTGQLPVFLAKLQARANARTLPNK